MKFALQRDLEPGDVFEKDDGTRYLVLEYGTAIYVGNRYLRDIPADKTVPIGGYAGCHKVGRVQYTEEDEPQP